MNTEQGVILKDLQQSSRETATASVTMAALAQAREARESSQAARDDQARQAAADRSSKALDRLSVWWAANWKYIAGIVLLVFYPQVIRQAQDLGIVPALKTEAPAPQIVPVPVPVRAQPEATAAPTEATEAPADD